MTATETVIKGIFGTILICFAGFAILIGCLIGYCWTTVNKEVDLRVKIENLDKLNTVTFDTMWKTISQKTQIVDKYKDDFKAIWPDLIAGRYQGASLMKWIQERNPEYDSSLYKDLMVTVESQRNKVAQGFQQVLDMKREHDGLIRRPASKFVLGIFGSTEPTNPVIVTSTRTNETFSTGTDDKVDLK